MTLLSLGADLSKKPRLSFFIAVSLCLHIALALSISAGNSDDFIKRHEIFDVDLVPRQKQEPEQKIISSEQHQESSSRSKEKQPALKVGKMSPVKYASVPISHSSGEREATVSLDAAAKKPTRYDSYLQHLRNRINAVWEYPEKAKEQLLAGRLTVRFTIDRNGTLRNVCLLESSGHELLDQEAVRTIYNAAPFDPLPSGLSLDRLNVLASFDYEFSPE